MNVLFLTLLDLSNLDEHGIYTDLLREFSNNGHQIYAVCPNEKRKLLETSLTDHNNNVHLLRVKIGNITQCGLIEKGISTLLIESQFKRAIKKYYKGVKFDLVLYSTPPITFANVVSFIKNRDGAKTFLMLKDIFPQNSVDLGMLKKTGIKGVIYHYFRLKEKKLYKISDYIGCTSPANIEYILNHNDVPKEKLRLSCNSVEPVDRLCNTEERNILRKKYDIPLDATVFVYGGNLGVPQDIPFVIECIESTVHFPNIYYLIIGSGTSFELIYNYVKDSGHNNIKIISQLPKEEFEELAGACDVGLIFLDHRFTVPNTPSRLLSYAQAHLPIICCTDKNTDVGDICQENCFGWKCYSDNSYEYSIKVQLALTADRKTMGDNAYKYTLEHYTSELQYSGIIRSVMNPRKE